MDAKALADGIYAIVVTLTLMIGSFTVLNNWVKNRGINKKKLSEVEKELIKCREEIREVRLKAETHEQIHERDVSRIESHVDKILDFFFGKK
jgi:hypothetical protein